MDKTLLRRLRGKPKVRKFCAIDIEATQWVNPYAVGFYDGTDYVDFLGPDCIRQALRHFLTPKYAGSWIYAHNGGNYDFLFFVKVLITEPEFRKRYRLEITPTGSCMVQIIISEKDGDILHKDGCNNPRCKGCETKRNNKGYMRWTLVDSARLMPIKLNELGKTFGLGEKVELKMSYDDLAKEENRPLMRDYLKQDCVILYKAVQKIQQIINDMGGQLSITLPATSLDVFRRRFQKDDIYTNRHFLSCPEYNKEYEKGEKPAPDACRGCMHDFIRDAYYGGRSEIFRMAFEPYTDKNGYKVKQANMWDINSHYPHCMLEAMPIGAAIQVDGLSEAAVYKNAKRLVGIVECDVYIPENVYLPPLPVRHNGKLVFPVGNLTGVWDAAELALLPKVGGKILRTRRSLWFETGPVFSRFIRTLYKFRDKTNPNWNKGLDWIAKILMNAAYGKFAMREERTRFLVGPQSPEGLTPIDMDCDIWSEKVLVSPTYVVPQLSVHITALARARLWEILHSVVMRGGRVYYTDTDSVVCSGVGFEPSKELGGLKHEATINRAQFVLPKLYLIETEEEQDRKHKEKHIKVKAKGMGPGIRVNQDGDDLYDGQLSELEFQNLVRKGVPIDRHRLTKFKEALKEYAKRTTTFPRVIPNKKEIQSQYDKRQVLDDYNTVPIKIEHFQDVA